MNIDPILSAIIDTADAANTAPDDYINPEDGLKYCGKCHTPKEAYFAEKHRFNGIDRHPTDCKCAAEERERREAEMREFNRINHINLLRSEAFSDIPAAAWRFDNAPVMTKQLIKAKEYAEKWDDFSREGIGLLLFGNVGTGKSYAAGCIANALIDRMISVLYVDMTDVVNRMQGNFGADRDSYLKRLTRPDLLILDDLGAERNTSYGKERIFDIVNRRLLSHKPMIITTNIALSVMQKATDLDDRRIYDRVLEVCVPVLFDGENFRRGNAAENLKKATRILNNENGGN